jgi:hypothetical protein
MANFALAPAGWPTRYHPSDTIHQISGAATTYLDALPIGLGSARDHGHDPSRERRLPALAAPEFTVEAHYMKPGVSPDRCREFRPAVGPHPTVAA